MNQQQHPKEKNDVGSSVCLSVCLFIDCLCVFACLGIEQVTVLTS